MSALSIQPTFPIFTETDGLPLENGYIWIGAANLDPQGNPINVYWDAALTIAAPQPIRTLNGYPSRSGTPARLYVNSDYSIRVQDKNASTIYSAPTATERYNDAVISTITADQVIYSPGLNSLMLPNGPVPVQTALDNLSDNEDGSSYVGFLQTGTNAVPTSVRSKLRGTVSVKDFGAIGDGVVDDTIAIQNAINSFTAGQGTIYFPKGIYLVTSTITINKDRMNLIGEGQWVSDILFNPTSDDICIFIGKGGEGTTNGGVIAECSVKGFRFTSSNRTNKKTALELKDIVECYFENISIGSTTQWIGNGSTGVRVRGREATTFSNMVVQTNRPFVLARNTSFPSLSLDHFNFNNILSICRGQLETVPVYDETHFFFEPGTNFSSVSFTGYQAWVRGKYGLYYDNSVTAAAGLSYSMNIQNVRWEGQPGDDDTGYGFYFDHGATSSVENVLIQNAYLGEIGNGYYFRKCASVTLQNNVWGRNSGVALNIASVLGSEFLQIINCFWQTGATASISSDFTAINAVRSNNTSPIFKSAIYTAAQGLDRRDSIIGVPVNQGRIDVAAANPTVVTLPLDATATVVGVFSDSRGKFAIIGFNVFTKTTTLIYDDGTWSVTQGTAAKLNVYWDAGSSTWKVENTTAISRALYFQALGSNQ